jgi:hypothetical protein
MAFKATADMWLKADLMRIERQLFTLSGNMLLTELLQALLWAKCEEAVECWYLIFWSGSRIRVYCHTAKLEDFIEVPLCKWYVT